jgi:hypothetical protein
MYQASSSRCVLNIRPCFPNGSLSPFRFLAQTVYSYLISPLRATYLAHLNRINLIILIFSKKYKLWKSYSFLCLSASRPTQQIQRILEYLGEQVNVKSSHKVAALISRGRRHFSSPSARNGYLELPVYFLKAKQGHTARKKNGKNIKGYRI